VVFNEARLDVEAILVRIRKKYNMWCESRLFCSDPFGFAESVPLLGGE
jgi:hypothetical protein